MKTKKEMRMRRKRRIRAKVNGTADRPRMTVYRSHKTISVQLVDDVKGKTLVGLSCRGTTIAKAKELGGAVAAAAKKKRITKAVFDRGGYKYHGVIKSLAEAAREGGLTI